MIRIIPIVILAGMIAEIASIIWVGRALGIVPTLLLLFTGGFLGVRLLKSAGTSVMEGLRSPVQPSSQMSGMGGTPFARILAGILFLVPGFFSDFLGIVVLIPPVQHWVRSRFSVKTFTAGTTGPHQPSGRGNFDTIIEGEAVEIVAEIEAPSSPGRSTH